MKAATMIPAPPVWRPAPLVIQRAAGPTVIDDVFEDTRVMPADRSVASLRHWIHYGSVNSNIKYANRRAKYGGGSVWEIGFTFYLRQGGRLVATWIWHVHAEGNGAGKINSVNSAHFKAGHHHHAGVISESGYAESIALLNDLFKAHGEGWVPGDEVSPGF